MFDDVIAAIATAHGVAGMAVVRVSGPGAMEMVGPIFRPKGGAGVEPGKMTYGAFVDEEGRPVDDGYMVFLPAPKTYTGEDVVELHTHGGLAAPAAVLSLVADRGARMAEPGEFTRRAVVSGRLDLAQAEAVLDVVHARSEAALRAARARLSGALSGRVDTIRERLVEAKALVEAAIDFEDEDVGDIDPENISRILASVEEDLGGLAETYRRGRIYREGALAVIAGRPNVGKSSLLNAFLGRRRAIVAESPGTTRDAVEDEAVLSGVPFRLVDTAGLRKNAGDIESAGIEIARERMDEADLIVFLIDASAGWTNEDRALREKLPAAPVIEVGNKKDLLGKGGTAQAAFLTCALTGDGLEELSEEMARVVAGSGAGAETALLASERHHRQVEKARSHVAAAGKAVRAGASPAITALEIRDAQNALGEILGKTTPDDVLDHIFSRFCVGK